MNGTDNSTRQIFIGCLLSGALIGLLRFLHYEYPYYYIYLITEDWWGENATFSFYFLSSCMLWFIIAVDESRRKAGFAAISLLTLFIAMEEISWGQRIFGISTPGFVTKYNYQDELNVHNALGGKLYLKQIFLTICLLWAGGLPFIQTKSQKVKEWTAKAGIPIIPYGLIPVFALGFYFQFFSSLAKSDEIAEMALGLAFFSLSLALLLKVLKNKSVTAVRRRIISISIAMAAVCLIIVLQWTSQDIDGLKWRLARSAQKDFPERGFHRQAIMVYEYLLRYPELRKEGAMLEYGLMLNARGNSRAEEILVEALNEERRHMRKDSFKPHHARNAAIALDALEETKAARKYFDEALRIDDSRFQKAEKDWQKVTALISMAGTYEAMKEYALALESLERAHVFARNSMESKAQIKENIQRIRARQQ